MTSSRSSARAEHPILDLPSIQRRIILAGWATYAIFYLGRLNPSATLSLFIAAVLLTPLLRAHVAAQPDVAIPYGHMYPPEDPCRT